MKRRDFVTTSMMGAALAAGEAGAADAPAGTARPQVFELRRYQFRFGPMEARFGDYAKGALIPVLNRLGVKPVGVFAIAVGPNAPAHYVLLAHPSLESVATLSARMTADADYQRAAATFRGLPPSDPPYVRRDSWLLTAFDSVPALEPPAGAVAGAGRVFELRTYESHNENAGLKKIEMFEKGGEVGIFRRVGMTPVFFARTLAGSGMPSLTYMLVFADMAAREKNWAAFREDAEWNKLRATPGYANTDILSNISNVLLRPTDYSQL